MKTQENPVFWIKKDRLERILSGEIAWPHVYTSDQSKHFECVPMYLAEPAGEQRPAAYLLESDFGTELSFQPASIAASARGWKSKPLFFSCSAPAPASHLMGLPQDVINLVIAAREAFDTGMLPSDENNALDKALEAFSSRVRYENEPKTKRCPACNGLGAFPETGYDCGECLGGGEVEAND